MKTRTEKEMFDLIKSFVEKDDKIRVAILNGSRANPNIKKDILTGDFSELPPSEILAAMQLSIIANK